MGGELPSGRCGAAHHRGVLSLADFLSLCLDHAGEVLGCDFGGGDGVGGPVDVDVGDASYEAVVTRKGDCVRVTSAPVSESAPSTRSSMGTAVQDVDPAAWVMRTLNLRLRLSKGNLRLRLSMGGRN